MEGEWGEILVPENRRQEASRLIGLKFRKIGRQASRPAVFHFTGGPGMSNLKQQYPRDLLEEYPIVEVGYRGIDSTDRLDCPQLEEALTQQQLTSAESLASFAKTFEGCMKRWRRQGIDVQGYQMRDVIEDAEELRKALGLDQVHLLAQSYGTRVALYYMSLHPEAINRSVLIGANPPGHFFWSAEDVQAGFHSYQRQFERAYPQYLNQVTLEELCNRVVQSLPARAMGIRLDAYIRAYADRNYDGLALMSLAYDWVIPGAFEWGDFFFKGLTTDYNPGRDYRAEAASDDRRFGSPLGTVLFGPPYTPALFAFRDTCLPCQERSGTAIPDTRPAMDSRGSRPCGRLLARQRAAIQGPGGILQVRDTAHPSGLPAPGD